MSELHLVRLPVDLRAFTTWALERSYLAIPPGDGRGKPRDPEIGYALHAALTGLFGAQAPRPFAIQPAGHRGRGRAADAGVALRHGMLDLLGYVRAPLETLRTLGHLADEELQSAIDWDGARIRPMPHRWPKNLRLRFGLRACPVHRIMKPLTTRPRPNVPATTLGKGREVDAFQVAAVRADDRGEPKPSRDGIYIKWLAERFAPRAARPQAVALVPNTVRVEAYRSVRLLRRPWAASAHRTPQWLTRPDVRFTGLLDVTDPDAFTALLASGVGRHCGFGFGMLLLKPA